MSRSTIRDAGRTFADAGLQAWQPRSNEGALIAIRLDLERIRASELARDIGDVIQQLPDVQALLAGSGVNPMTDLSRLLVASPDLSRSKALIAGQHTGDQRLPRAAAARLAAVQGKSASFVARDGMEVAPWHSPDGVGRVLALLGPSRFVIARGKDLPKVMAIARAWAPGKRDAGVPAGSGLLALPSDAVAQLNVEAVDRFVRRAEFDLPSRISTTIRLHADARAALTATTTMTFAGKHEVVVAAAQISKLLTGYGRHPLVQLTGLGGALTGARVKPRPGPEHYSVEVQISLTRLQAQTALGMLRDATAPPDTQTGTRDNLPTTTPAAGRAR